MRSWRWPILFAIAYFLLGRLGHQLVDRPGGSAVYWPPNGLYLAALLLAPRRRWPAFVAAGFLGSLVASLAFGRSLAVAILYFAGNSAEVIASALALPLLLGGPVRAGTVRGALALALVPAAAGLAVSGALTMATLLVTGGAVDPRFWIWWAGSALGAVIVAPLVLAFADPDERMDLATRARRLELAGLVAAHGAAAAALAWGRPGVFWATELVVLPPMLWAAVRFGIQGSTASALAMASAVVVAAARGRGLLARAAPDPGGEVLSIQFFLGLLLLTVLLAGAASSQAARDARHRARIGDRLRRAARAARLWRIASDRATDAILMIEPGGAVLYANEAAARLLGVPARELRGRPAWSLVPGGTEPLFRAFWEGVARAGRFTREEWIPVGGQHVPHELTASILQSGDGPVLVQSLRDLSQRRKAEAAARLAGVGTLAAGVAHEINNPLTYVGANLDLADEALRALAERPADAPAVAAEARQLLADARTGAGRVRDIVRDLRGFSREEEGVGPVDVRAPVQAALGLARNELRHRARVVTRLDGPLPPVAGNERRLAQVFLNLLVNAAQAIPPGRADEHVVEVTAAARAGAVEVSVRDTGGGMAPAVKARLFEPFFTTKPVGEGTGLGLSICHGIVTGLGGRIEVESEPGAGTTVRVLLPAAAPATEPGPAPGQGPVRQAGHQGARWRVLVVDDEALVATTVRRLLRGHDVTVVHRAREALALAERGERFDAVLCDLMMPEVTGMELFAALERLRPDLAARTIFITGGAFTESARAFLERHEGRRLEKPFEPAALREALEGVVGELGLA